MSAAFELVAVDARRRKDYVDLLHAAWGDDALDAEEFDWWFDGNPEGSLLAVADVDGRTVGVLGHSLLRAVVGGEPTLVDLSVHATTATEARGLGVFRALELRHQQEGLARGSTATFVFANDASRPVFLGPLGYARIDRRRVWIRPGRRLPARALGRRAPAGLPPATSTPAQGALVQPVGRFGAAADAAYAAAAPRLRNHFVRDARHLNWRYLDSPRGYRAFETPSGFAVVGQKRQRGLATAYVADLVAPPAEARALLGRCLEEVRATAEVVAAVPTPTLPRSVLARAGFVPSPATLDFLGRGLAGPLDLRGGAWTLSLGDADFF